MGRTIKISELKKFDVFKITNYDLQYIVFDDGFCCTWNQGYHFRLKKDFCCEEVELLGRMEFVENRPINNISDENLDTMRQVFL